MALAKRQRSLKAWAKRKAKRAGKQFSKQPKSIASKVRRFRSFS